MLDPVRLVLDRCGQANDRVVACEANAPKVCQYLVQIRSSCLDCISQIAYRECRDAVRLPLVLETACGQECDEERRCGGKCGAPVVASLQATYTLDLQHKGGHSAEYGRSELECVIDATPFT